MRIASTLLILVTALFYLVAAPSYAAVQITDALGQRFALDKPYRRVISLAPSLTEEVFDLGRGSALVADTTYCLYPPEALKKPKVGPMLTPDLERILSFRPQLVLATFEGNPPDTVNRLRALNVPIFVFGESHTFNDIDRQFRTLAAVLGAQGTGGRLAARARLKVESVGRCVRQLPPSRVFIQIGDSPLVTTNGRTFTDEIVRDAGGVNIFENDRSPWPRVSEEAVVGANPDAILISTQAGFNEPARAIWARYPGLRAARTNRILLIDAHHFATPTPLNFAAAVESIARLLHPEAAACIGKS